jgi:hypothetical protein
MNPTLNRTENAPAQTIQRQEWIPFLAQFTLENRGAHARLDIVGATTDVGYQVETEDRPFDGVAADVKGSESTVWITFASTADNHIAHGVHHATAIRVLGATLSRGPVLEVEDADGNKTILELTDVQSYALPPAGQTK